MKKRIGFPEAIKCLVASVFFAIAFFSGLTVSLIDGVTLQSAHAAVVSRIEVRGNQRVEDDTIKSYLTISPNRSYNSADLDRSVKALFSTGLFEDIQVYKSGGALIVQVRENPYINKVAFEGNKKIKDKSLKSAIESKSQSIFVKSQVQSDVRRILSHYRRSGRYGADVTPKVISLPDNRVDLVFEISEGDKTDIAEINFVGNRAFGDRRLRDTLQTKQSSIFSFLNTQDKYDQDRIEADKESLRRFYHRYGYADFRVISAIANLDRERNVFFITFTIDEGQKYSYGEVEVRSSIAEVDPEDLRGLVLFDPGDTFNSSEVEKSTESITVKIARSGFAFATVKPNLVRNFEQKTIDVSFSISEGTRSYVERINIRGNLKTRDYVIRREFDIAEGDAFNRVLVERAKRRLERLDFFETVTVSYAPGSDFDRIIVNVDVVEKSTGSFGIGGGYSSTNGAIGEIKFHEKNFVGRGQDFQIAVGIGENSLTQRLSFTEPFFLGNRIAAGFDLYAEKQDAQNGESYNSVTRGGALRLGFQMNDELRVDLRNSLFARKTTDNDGNAANNSFAARQLIGNSQFTLYNRLDIFTTYDTRNDRVYATDGEYLRVTNTFGYTFDTANSRFVKIEASGASYHDILPEYNLIGLVKGHAGAVNGLGTALDITDQFKIGNEKIRGFRTNGIGPRELTTRDSLGAKYYVAATAELRFPAPLFPRSLGINMAAFVDAGTAFDTDFSAAAGNLIRQGAGIRASAGLGVMWRSPFGPLRVDFAYPFLKESYDETQYFHFGIASDF